MILSTPELLKFKASVILARSTKKVREKYPQGIREQFKHLYFTLDYTTTELSKFAIGTYALSSTLRSWVQAENCLKKTGQQCISMHKLSNCTINQIQQDKEVANMLVKAIATKHNVSIQTVMSISKKAKTKKTSSQLLLEITNKLKGK